jgi:hypothetical protein
LLLGPKASPRSPRSSKRRAVRSASFSCAASYLESAIRPSPSLFSTCPTRPITASDSVHERWLRERAATLTELSCFTTPTSASSLTRSGFVQSSMSQQARPLVSDPTSPQPTFVGKRAQEVAAAFGRSAQTPAIRRRLGERAKSDPKRPFEVSPMNGRQGITTGQAKGQTQRWQPLQPNLARVNEAARDPARVLSEEPTAVTPHGGICGG